MKNWRTLAVAIALCAGTATLSLAPTPAMAASQLDRVAAVVNNDVILESEVDELLRSVKQNAKQANQQLPVDETLRSQIMERLIVDSIVLQIGQSAGVDINDAEVDQSIANIAQQNRLSMAQLRKYLAADGINYTNYREQIRKEMLLAEVRNNEVRRRVTILPQEIDALAQQLAQQESNNTELNVSHILIGLPENPSQKQVDQAEKQAISLLDQLEKGANFGKLAATYSSDGQALNGGQMGWGKIEELPSLFTEPLRNSKKGDVVGPIRSGVGFHLLKVNDVRNAQPEKITATEVNARHILIKPSVIMTDEQVQNKLVQLVQDIKSGKITFADAAEQNSQDPGSAKKGGELGWALPDVYDPGFRNALLGLKKGEISQPIRSAYGWHIIQLADSRQIDATNDARKEQAYRMLFNRKFAEEAQTWMQELRASAYVRIMD